MILVDSNLLLYCNDLSSPFCSRAQAWAEAIVNGSEAVGLPWITIVAFLRITTQPGFGRPLAIGQAIEAIDEWLDRPNVRIVAPGPRHWAILKELMPEAQVRGKLVTDAHLAALAIETGSTFCTNDLDFARFPGLKVTYPLKEG